MERKYLIVLTATGIAAGLYVAITYQWVLMAVIVALAALILIASGIMERIKLQSEAFITGVADLRESVASIQCTVEKIEQRLSEPESR
ncbi:hypothetical protein [Methanoculleus sp.]|uniref:hypothetical protein n=1 Tax=Methanoculleus sp. TaxID=90427 RepID=UPI00272E9053|nr:hypothetical protein [Methanoculleus sp.]